MGHRQMLGDRRRLDSDSFDELNVVHDKKRLDALGWSRPIPDCAEEPWVAYKPRPDKKQREKYDNKLWKDVANMFHIEKEKKEKKEKENCPTHQRFNSLAVETAHYGEVGYRFEPSEVDIKRIEENIKSITKQSNHRDALRRMYTEICFHFLEPKKYKIVVGEVRKYGTNPEAFNLLRDYARYIALEIIVKMDWLSDFDRVSKEGDLYYKLSIRLRDEIKWVEGSLIHNAMHSENVIRNDDKNALRWGCSDIDGARELREALADRNSPRTRYFDEVWSSEHGVWNKIGVGGE